MTAVGDCRKGRGCGPGPGPSGRDYRKRLPKAAAAGREQAKRESWQPSQVQAKFLPVLPHQSQEGAPAGQKQASVHRASRLFKGCSEMHWGIMGLLPRGPRPVLFQMTGFQA